jgi:hypothetical protein
MFKSKHRCAMLPAVLATLVAAVSPAQAQVEGWYTGVASDGLQFGMYVERDVNGQMIVNGINLYGPFTCPSGASRLEGPAAYIGLPVVQGHLHAETRDPGYFLEVDGDFSADGLSFTGTGMATLPRFKDVNTSVKATEGCTTHIRHIVATTTGLSSAPPSWLSSPPAPSRASH